MKRWVMKSLSLALVVIISISLMSILPVNADANSITVSPSTIIDSINSGTSKTYTITVTNGFALKVEVDGLGETTGGATTAVTPQNDTNSFSARSWITVDKSQLDIGNDQTLTVVVTIPSTASPSQKYASIFLYSAASSQGSAGIISGVIIPIIITVNSSSFTPNITGQLTTLSVPQAYNGNPVDVLTTFNNTGNCLITNASNKITIKDSTQNVKWLSDTPIAAPSIMPNYPRVIDTKYNIGLTLGNYTVESDITLDNGVVYTKTTSFTVIPIPPIPTVPVLISPGNNTVPGPVIDTLTPILRWNAVSGADYYVLTVVRDPYGSSDAVYTSDQLTGTSFTLPSGILFGGQNYAWQMTATNIAGTSGNSTLFYFESPGSSVPPAVTSNAASNITSFGTTLNGNLTALGTATTVNVDFQYGTSISYGSETSAQSMTSTGAFNADVIGLTANTTYHYRAKAVGSSLVYGNDMTFTTAETTTSTTTATSTTQNTTPQNTTPPISTTTTPISRDYKGYFPPVIDESSLSYQDFTNDANSNFNAADKTGAEVSLTGTNKSGTIIIVRYLNAPQTTVQFSGGAIKGGTGKSSIKFVGVRVEGTTKGTARVTVHYTADEVSKYNINSLFLSYFSGGSWHKCSNISISSQNNTVSGDIPVSRLSGTAIGLGGDLTQAAGGLPIATQNNNTSGTPGVSWALVGIVMVSILIVGGVIFAIERNRRKTQVDK